MIVQRRLIVILVGGLKSALGQARRFRDVRLTSGLPPTADISGTGWHFAFGPQPDIAT